MGTGKHMPPSLGGLLRPSGATAQRGYRLYHISRLLYLFNFVPFVGGALPLDYQRTELRYV